MLGGADGDDADDGRHGREPAPVAASLDTPMHGIEHLVDVNL
jgi:hypothetical protein